MAWPVVLFAAGAALNMYGQYQANKDQSEAEARNAAFLREQQALEKKAKERELRLQSREQDMIRGEQIGAFASANISLSSGSAIDFLVDQEMQGIEERYAIHAQGDLRYKLAGLRAEDSERTSQRLGSFEHNFIQGLGTGLSAFGTGYGLFGKPGTPGKPTTSRR